MKRHGNSRNKWDVLLEGYGIPAANMQAVMMYFIW
jgi:hypothetical protein